ncbi:hypothetical protein [Nonomuraea maritima]|uniref:hypothetical protein n=1 Tax=Nonomuraea maritima TaxID=683260 RepID=UPI00115FB4AA|nr:hypothetical protein [Nonomuraea maritima]
MQSAITSLIAIAGTLLGAAATYVFQARAAKQARLEAREERLWQEQLAAYSAYAGAITSYRASQSARWYRKREDPGGSAYINARDEALNERANAKAALFRLRLLNPDAELGRLASEALDVTTAIHRAQDDAAREEQAERSQAALLAFVESASAQIRARATQSTSRRPSIS